MEFLGVIIVKEQERENTGKIMYTHAYVCTERIVHGLSACNFHALCVRSLHACGS